MNYKEALDYIDNYARYGSHLGLETMGILMDKLGNPQDKLKCIHVAGTNGKGSTSSFLANSLEEAGYKVGLFTSPFLERFNERIQINGKDIPDDTLARLTKKLKEKIDIMKKEGHKYPTTFEMITALMFMYFEEEKVDYIVLEVGLGGRYDSTNIIKKPLISIITTIGFDHVSQLGNTLEEIAYQKAGIIKKESLVVSYPQIKEVEKVIENVAKEKKSKLYLESKENINIIEQNDYGSVFDYKFKNYKLKDVKIGMIGVYQIYNASLAISSLMILRENNLINITDEQILRGIKKTRWPGRLEVLKREPTFLTDGAHNEQGVKQLKKALTLFDYENLILGIGVLQDKDVDYIVKTLVSKADIVIVTEVDDIRKEPVKELAKKVKKEGKNPIVKSNIKSAVIKSMEIAEKNDLIVFGGSLYLVGEVRGIINRL